MSRIFITGSSDGLGQLAARQLISEGHQVVLHARNKARGEDALAGVPGAESVLVADLSDMEATKELAAEANDLGVFDAVIHNAGVYKVPRKTIFMVNSLAPYILTSLMHKPKRLIYISSRMHSSGKSNFRDFDPSKTTYSDSKLHNVIMTMAVAKKWPNVYVNTVDPGWVPTKMGGAGASGNLEKGYQTQAWLAGSEDAEAEAEAEGTGRYFYHKQVRDHRKEADDLTVQEEYFQLCAEMSGVEFPR